MGERWISDNGAELETFHGRQEINEPMSRAKPSKASTDKISRTRFDICDQNQVQGPRMRIIEKRRAQQQGRSSRIYKEKIQIASVGLCSGDQTIYVSVDARDVRLPI